MKLIYLPIETKSREFDSKCLIALRCLDQGYAVVLGGGVNFMSALSQPGLILLKSAAGFEHNRLLALKQKKMVLCVLDEEGVVHTSFEKEHALRFSQKTIDTLDGIFFNGTKERDVMVNFFDIKRKKIHITGNPRFDFYKQDFKNFFLKESSDLKSKWGDYILMTSRFGEVDMATKDGYIDHLKKIKYISNKKQELIFSKFLDNSKKIHSEFINMLPKLSKRFPNLKIIVRPHPSESSRIWVDTAKKLENVHIVRDGAIGPWLLGSKVVIHNGCTTGLEAFLMNKPVFSYMPFQPNQYDLALPNNVSFKCSDVEELLNRVELSVNNEIILDVDREKKEKYASSYLANTLKKNYAYINIVSKLPLYTKGMETADLKKLKLNFKQRSSSWINKIRGSLAVRVQHRKLKIFNFLGDGYSHSKNPGFSSKEISEAFKRMSDITNINIDQIKIEKIDEYTFLIKKVDKNSDDRRLYD